MTGVQTCALPISAVEALCDEVNEKIRKEAEERGLYARPRFSPGYGDFPLEVQRDFERILMMRKKTGIALTDSLLMTPTKSVTAVIGLSPEKRPCHKAGCEECAMAKTCEYSRSDKIGRARRSNPASSTPPTAPSARTQDRKSTRLNSSHTDSSRMPSSA